eukprot:GHVU01161195.1.p1 GENE.GHVU01161195.1~~GHVU01161195.1.p1  ORF type:complete len:146 (+),score=16.03 GHVU01161195.1:1524-1961(+)
MSESSKAAGPDIEHIFVLRGPKAADFWTQQEEFAGLAWQLLQEEYYGFAWLDRVHYRRIDPGLWAVVVEDSSCSNPCCIGLTVSVPVLDWCVDQLVIEEFRDGQIVQPPPYQCEWCGKCLPKRRADALPLEKRGVAVRIRQFWYL